MCPTIATSTMPSSGTVMFVATAVFFILYYALVSSWQNDALWFAFIFFLIFRGLLMLLGQRRFVFSTVSN